jgi:hypothetical protein
MNRSIPVYADKVVPILFWEPVEFAIAMTLLMIGMFTHLFLLGALGAAGTLYGAAKLRKGAKRGATQHFLWASGLSVDNRLKRWFPPAHMNELIE